MACKVCAQDGCQINSLPHLLPYSSNSLCSHARFVYADEAGPASPHKKVLFGRPRQHEDTRGQKASQPPPPATWSLHIKHYIIRKLCIYSLFCCDLYATWSPLACPPPITHDRIGRIGVSLISWSGGVPRRHYRADAVMLWCGAAAGSAHGQTAHGLDRRIGPFVLHVM